MKKFWQLGKSYWQFIVVTLFGAFLRFYRLRELTTFGGDQGVDYQFVAQMIMSGRLRLLGPITHVGIFLGPLYYYLLIPFFVLFRFDPIAAPFFFALVGSLTVGFVYILARKFLSNSIAFLASLLYAASPVIIESSRAPSQPDLIPFLSTVFLLSIIRVIEKKQRLGDGIVLGIVLGSAIQFHYLTFPMYLFFGLVMGWLWITRKQDRNGFLQLTIYILFFAALLLSPWLLFELRNQFFISKQIIGFLGTGEISIKPIDVLIRFFDLSWFTVSRLISTNSQFLTLGGVVMVIAGSLVRRVNTKSNVLFLYAILNLAGISLYKNPLENHYIAALYSATIILVSIGISTIFSKRIAFFILFLLFFLNISRYNPFRDNGYTMPSGVTTRTIQDTSRIIALDWKKQYKTTFNVINTLDGDTRAQPYRYVLMAVENIVPADVEHYPDSDVLYVVTDLSRAELLKDSRWELASFPVATLTKIATVKDNIFVYRMTAGTVDRSEVR